MPKCKVGTDDFKQLRDEGGYCVDKSLLIKEVIDGSKALLLPRPRRFGKTLNHSIVTSVMILFVYERQSYVASSVRVAHLLAAAR